MAEFVEVIENFKDIMKDTNPKHEEQIIRVMKAYRNMLEKPKEFEREVRKASVRRKQVAGDRK